MLAPTACGVIRSVLQMAICKTPTIVNCHLSTVNFPMTGDARTSNARPYGVWGDPFRFADGNLQNTDNSQFSLLNSQFPQDGDAQTSNARPYGAQK